MLGDIWPQEALIVLASHGCADPSTKFKCRKIGENKDKVIVTLVRAEGNGIFL